MLLSWCPISPCMHVLRTALYMLSLGRKLINTMSLSWVRAPTPVFCNHGSANELVPTTILGPSQCPGDYLRIQYEVNGKVVIHDADAPHRLEFHIPSPSPSPSTSSKPETHGEHCCVGRSDSPPPHPVALQGIIVFLMNARVNGGGGVIRMCVFGGVIGQPFVQSCFRRFAPSVGCSFFFFLFGFCLLLP